MADQVPILAAPSQHSPGPRAGAVNGAAPARRSVVRIRAGSTLQPRAEPAAPQPPSDAVVLGIRRVVEESILETNTDGQDVETDRRTILDETNTCNKIKRFKVEDENGEERWVYCTVKKDKEADPLRPGYVHFGRANFSS